jgi:hypothetical protein
VAWAVNVKGVPSNKPMNPTHFAASRRLQETQASRRGLRAGYRHRYADKNDA